VIPSTSTSLPPIMKSMWISDRFARSRSGSSTEKP